MKKKVSYTFLKTLATFAMIFFAVSIFFIKNLEEIYTDEINTSIEVELENKVTTLKNTLKSLKKDIVLLSKYYTNETKSLNYFLTFKKEFSNAKVIEIDNKELVDLPYYNILQTLKKDDIYLSEIKLRKLNDVLVNPRVAILDVITPIFNKDGKKVAFLTIEYNMEVIFNEIRDNSSGLKTIFLNNQNYILNSELEEENFGFLFGKEPSFENISNLIYKVIDPIKELSPNLSIDLKSYWKIATIPNYSKINEKIENYLNSLSWIVFLYFLIAIFISYIFAEYKNNEKESKIRLKISNNVFENSHEGIIITNHENKIIQVNKTFTQITGYTEKEILYKTPSILKADGFHTKQFYKNIWDSLDTTGYWEGEITNEKKDGTTYIEELTISKIITEENDTYYISSFVDITENKKNRKIIEDKIEENKIYLEIINDYLISLKVDLNGKILDVSDAFCRISGHSKNEIEGNTHDIFRHPETTKEFYVDIWNLIYSGKTWEGELKNLKKNGETYYVHAKISPIYSNNTISGYASIAVDITDKKRVEEMSITDELTQTHNRRYFNTVIEKELLRAKRDRKTLGFAILDIDYFKQYNDTYGHTKGDMALKEVANILKASMNRASDYLFRLGGEEFGILVTDINEKNFKILLEKIRTNIEDLHIEHSKNSSSNFVTASFGGVVFNSETSEKKMYKTADKLLYKAKENGRNRVFVENI